MVLKYDFKKHFQDFENSPPVSNDFPLAKIKAPPEVLLLSVNRVFVIESFLPLCEVIF
jgi:hypothetical protein